MMRANAFWFTAFVIMAVITAIALGAPALVVDMWNMVTGTNQGVPAR